MSTPDTTHWRKRPSIYWSVQDMLTLQAELAQRVFPLVALNVTSYVMQLSPQLALVNQLACQVHRPDLPPPISGQPSECSTDKTVLKAAATILTGALRHLVIKHILMHYQSWVRSMVYSEPRLQAGGVRCVDSLYVAGTYLHSRSARTCGVVQHLLLSPQE